MSYPSMSATVGRTSSPSTGSSTRPGSGRFGARGSGGIAARDVGPEHVRDRRQDVEFVHGFLDAPRLGALRVVDEKGYVQALLVDRVVVLLEAVLAEALAVVAQDHEDGLFVETEILVLIEELLQEKILVADGV